VEPVIEPPKRPSEVRFAQGTAFISSYTFGFYVDEVFDEPFGAPDDDLFFFGRWPR
jgi:hypothetical protein